MTISSDDPRLTAYALDEHQALTPEERDAIEALLTSSEESRRAVEDVRATASQLLTALGSEPSPKLTEERRRRVVSRAHRKPRFWLPAAAAAALAGVALVSVTFRQMALYRAAEPPSVAEKDALAPQRMVAPMQPKLVPTPMKAPASPPPPADAETLRQLESLGYISGKTPEGFAYQTMDDDIDRLRRDDAQFNTEGYQGLDDNPFLRVTENPVSTFSLDVDTASYSNVRRFLSQGRLPPRDAVRIEELVNYFPYDYAPPRGEEPFAVDVEIAEAPWQPEHRLVRVGLKGSVLPENASLRRNLVFLLDVSGSMDDPAKLPLVKRALELLVSKLGEGDRVAIVVYAGASGLALPSTSGDRKEVILAALDRLQAGGSTNGGEGIRLAYSVAEENLIRGGVNRVILATDGDFNVGVTSHGELTRLIEEKAKSGIFLSVLGFGMGNYKDSTLESLADRGNGNYGYVDTLQEARKLLVEQLAGTLVTIAKDVKIQIEFNPSQAAGYRLIGYENRLLRREDFNDDTKDAGEIGAGHTVTALYEVVPAGSTLPGPRADPLKYQTPGPSTVAAGTGELVTLKLRYKAPDGDASRLITFPIKDPRLRLSESSGDFRFAAAVAAFGMLLRDSPYKGEATPDLVLKLSSDGLGQDSFGYRREFVRLVQVAGPLLRK